MNTLLSHLQPEALSCEYGQNPMGIDILRPRLFWKLRSEQRGSRQTAYRIIAASSLHALEGDSGDFWDTGKVDSDESLHIPYEGVPLASSQQVFWKVCVWDEQGRASAWSQAASWTMGLTQPSDWQASWVTAREALRMVHRRHLGFRSREASMADVPKWVLLNMEQSLEISEVILHPAQWKSMEGYGFPVRFRVILTDWRGFEEPGKVFDFTEEDFPNPGNGPVTINCQGVMARTIRVEAVKLWGDEGVHLFALSQIEVVSRGANATQDSLVSASDSAEGPEWSTSALADGLVTSGEKRYASMRVARDYHLPARPRRAIVHVCGLGYYEMSVNGHRVGNDLLTPGWADYKKSCLYDTYDITDSLQSGENRFEILLGNGFYNVSGGRYTKFRGSFGPLAALAHIRIEHADGRVEIIGTDDSWRVRPGPITFSCVYGGEDYDARLEGSIREDLNDWERPMLLNEPGREMRGFCGAASPIRAIESLPARNEKALRPGVVVYDLGQNASVMPRLTVSGPAGSWLTMTPAELLGSDGAVERCSVGGGEAYWKYTLGGRNEEQWFPKFYYHGCRYLQVEAHPAVAGGELPRVVALEGVVVHSSSPAAGEFACSNELFNQIRELIRWAQRSNMMHVLTDCPHREKLGWLEEYYLNGPAIRYEFNLARLFSKGVQDMADAQLVNGLVPDIAPEYVVCSGGFRDSPEWGSSYIISAWQQYLWHGDLVQLRRHYTGMKRYVDYLGSRAHNGILQHGLGDWLDRGPGLPGPAKLTPPTLTATAVYYYDACLLSRIARLLGREAEVQHYGELAAEIFRAFNAKFRDPKTGLYATGSQCANAIALEMGFVPEEDRGKVLQAIVADVEKHGNALTPGDIGHRYLLRALANNGRSDVIFAINNQSEKPGYGFQLRQGATSLAESWDADRSLSQNHFMLGQLTEWFYHDLVGIGVDEEAPAFRNVIIRPQPVGDIRWARASHESLRGRIAVEWERDETSFRLSLGLPANTTATVYLPCPKGAEIREGEKPFVSSETMRVLCMEEDRIVLQVASGAYQFKTIAPGKTGP